MITLMNVLFIFYFPRLLRSATGALSCCSLNSFCFFDSRNFVRSSACLTDISHCVVSAFNWVLFAATTLARSVDSFESVAYEILLLSSEISDKTPSILACTVFVSSIARALVNQHLFAGVAICRPVFTAIEGLIFAI